ncbi:MAG: type I glutamate--ammonia ligase [Candidatus Sabulitectum sp.]|nr:type I glutamate--ammonia ligase [Candidatus Sabulitectum sp.]
MSSGIIEAVQKRLKEKGIEEIDIRFTDLLGYWRHVTIPVASAPSDLFLRGVGFDGSTLDGMSIVESGDLALVPDPRRLYFDPFAKKKTVALLGDIVDYVTGHPYSRDPRGIAKKADNLLKFSGIATDSFWAPEFEFNLFDKARFWNKPGELGYEFGNIENPTASEDQASHGLVHPTHSGYHAMFPVDSLHDIRSEMVSSMQDAGISVKYHHHEVGRWGQSEIEVNFSPMLISADNVMITKHIIRNVALENSMAATFMPKPMPDEPGNGMHFHLYFEKAGDRIFFQKDGYCSLSPTARSAIAGILHHARALCAFTNPSVNSYQRLVPNQEAPVYRFFSGPNRSAAVRVPAYALSPKKMRFEYRVPDGTCNPYLAMSAMLMAAIDGIKNEMVPEEMGFGPIDENVFAEGYDTSNLACLPASLDEALNSLEDDREFLESNDVFTPDLIDAFMEVKRNETALFRGNPHPLEHRLYFSL